MAIDNAVKQVRELTGEDRAKALVIARYRTAEKSQAKQLTKMDDWFRMYKNERVNANYRGTSNIVVPKAFEKAERRTALISQSIKRINVTGQGQEDKENAKVNEKLIEYEIRALGINKKIKSWIKSTSIHGTGFVMLTWDVALESKEEPFRGISVKVLDPRSVFFNPDHTCEEGLRWSIAEEIVPYAEVAKNPLFKPKIAEVKATSQLGGYVTRDTSRNVKKYLDTRDESTLMVNLKRYFGPFSPEEDGIDTDYCITVANDAVVLKAVPSPYAEILDNPVPIFPMYLFPVPHEPYGVGDIEAAESLITELNDTRNQRMDTVTMNIDPAKIVLRSAQIEESDLVAKKGWVIKSNQVNGVQFLPPDMQGVVASINEEKIIQGDIDRVTGMPSFGAKTPVSGDITTDTATGVNATLQAQDVVSNSVLESVKESLLSFYRAILAYNQAFIDRGFVISVVGDNNEPQPEMIMPERIRGNMDLDIDVELVGNRLARRAEALQALQVGQGIPGTNMGKLWEDYLETHDKYNFQEYYQPPQPVPPEPPKVSVSLSGDLSMLQASKVAQTIPGVDKSIGDPLMTSEGRLLMEGIRPEKMEIQDKSFDKAMQVHGAKSKNDETKLKYKDKKQNDD